jgi:hypothetical protein
VIVLQEGKDLMPLRVKHDVSLYLFQRWPWEIYSTFTFPDGTTTDSADRVFKNWIRWLSKSEKIQIASKYVIAKKRKHSPPHIHALMFGHNREFICLELRANFDRWEHGFLRKKFSIVGAHTSYEDCCGYLAGHLIQGGSAAASTHMYYNKKLLDKMNLREHPQLMESYRLRLDNHDLLHTSRYDHEVMRNLGEAYYTQNLQ